LMVGFLRATFHTCHGICGLESEDLWIFTNLTFGDLVPSSQAC